MTDGYQIVSPDLTVKALRDSGYKSTAHALAELIDNGIEAGATLVEVFAVEEPGVATEKVRHRIDRIAVLDNGSGMDSEVLRRALKFGDGTRHERKGIGRFGMGLPNSSMSQCERVDVWSWTNGPDNALRTYLDLDEIRKGMSTVPQPVHDPLPDEWRELSEGLATTGTLVVWSRLDRVQWRGAATTLRHTEFLIGRIYRKFLADGRVRIRLVPVRNGRPTEGTFDARPNDPLYLTAVSSTPPPFHDQPMFEPFGAGSTGLIGVEEFDIEVDGEVHKVTVRAAMARDVARRADLADTPWPEQHRAKEPGATPWGQHARRNAGISLIRAERELDLDDSWVNDYDPIDRWWGVEVDFPPGLDEIFGVTNNKQAATTFTSLAHFDWKAEAEPGETYLEFKQRLAAEGDPRLPLIDLVHYLRDKLLPRLRAELKEQTRGTRPNRKRYDSATVKASYAIKRRVDEGHTGLTDDLSEQKTPDESRQEQLESLTRTHRFSREDAERLIEETLAQGRHVRMITSHQPDSPAFFNVEFFPELLQVALNMDHPVFEHLVASLDDDTTGLTREDLAERLTRAATAFKVLLFSWARFEDEQPPGPRERARKMRWEWGMLAKEFFSGADDEDD
ncbi:DNA mismatch repair protein [Carbonactinospora thermoautotrophica]|uniref:ATP-binding protein n=1 Tax=Carbonactinospora thermoautotrophica TaxID=1469144 RepID=UPI00226D8AA0|nr:ATP-binding protein [Carbonactinospora thermoautotrophica]MCX9193856.1 DNA mismatch repair protein [Carbonactinospora thermoautotrophica]